MKTFIVSITTIAVSAFCLAQGPSTQLADSPGRPGLSAGPASMPSPAPAATAADLASGAIDPFDSGTQRAKFFKAAAQDSELSKDEFQADAKTDGGFVRSFDRWEAMLAFDKDRNGTIAWFEAEAYRQDQRKKVLALFDKNADSRLTGDEREQANRWLLAANFSNEPASRPATAASGPFGRGRGNADMAGRFGRNRDGQGGNEEGRAAMDAARKEMLARYDKNGDGQIDNEERQAMMADNRRANGNQAMQQKMEALGVRLFDADGNGELDDNEKAQRKAFEGQLKKIGDSWNLMMNDLDGNGTISPEERQVAASQWRNSAFKVMAKSVKYMDSDGDGKVSMAERQGFQQRVQEAAFQWTEGFIARFDANGDGKLLDAAEQDALVKGLETELADRRAKFDKDSNGLLDVDEMLEMMEDFGSEMGIKPVSDTSASQPALPQPAR